MKNILFYKYVEIKDPISFQRDHQQLCDSLGLLGKVLVATEGINGCLSGEDDAVETYKKELTSDERFQDLVFKEGNVKDHTFRKMFVKVRDEIITSHFGVDARNAAEYVEPQTLKEWFDNGEDMILLDARNDYETKVGMFEGAIDPHLKNFQEFKEVPKKFEDLKDKKIVTYCTGGIRCEKASALLKENGFTSVYQLHGGILQYGKECGNAHWKGECLVFDRRDTVNIDPKLQSGELSEEIQRKIEQNRKPGEYVGKIVNYFKKAQAAELVPTTSLRKGDKIVIMGPTTGKIEVVLDHIQDDDAIIEEASPGQDITFSLSMLVRANDTVYRVEN